MKDVSEEKSKGIKAYLDKRVLVMFNFGFSSGLPLMLIFSSLSLWLREAGIDRSSVTYFSWAALGFSFKFIWAPLVDRLPIPFLTKLCGRRKSWLLLSQSMVLLSIALMAMVNPAQKGMALSLMAVAAVMLGFSAATQDIVIDAFRIECAEAKMQGILSSVYIAGYRVAMIVSGAGALYLAEFFGSAMGQYSYSAWQTTYFIMSLCMLLGLLTAFVIKEPVQENVLKNHSIKEYSLFFAQFILIVIAFIFIFSSLNSMTTTLKAQLILFLKNDALVGFIGNSIRLCLSILGAGITGFIISKVHFIRTPVLKEGYVDPIIGFFDKYGKQTSLLILSLIGLYRISDIVLGVISNVFYQDLGFSKTQIASVVKTFGLIMSLFGGFVGGYFTTRFGVMRILWWGAVLSALTNLLFMALATMGENMAMLYLVISADNLAAGLASAAFVAFLSSLTNISFTAVQYAIFTSLMTLVPKIIGGYSGSMVDSLGYPSFFAFTAIIGVPVIILINICKSKLDIDETKL